MGNTIGRRSNKAKIMKISGETFKFKTPAKAKDVIKDYPGYVLLDSEAVKHFGVRTKPLESEQDLKPKKIYFLVELPKFPKENNNDNNQPSKLGTRRVRSGIQMSAKDRLEFLMLSKRSVSDISVVRPNGHVFDDRGPVGSGSSSSGPIRVKMRLPKAQVEKLMHESGHAEIAEKIVDLFMENSGDRRCVHWQPELGSIGENLKLREKRVCFEAEGEIQVATDSH